VATQAPPLPRTGTGGGSDSTAPILPLLLAAVLLAVTGAYAFRRSSHRW
jgi:hypothetical protein